MAVADDLNAPLGQETKTKSRFTPTITAPQVIAAGLGVVVLTFALWIIFVDDPMGGEPVQVTAIETIAVPSEAKKQGDTITVVSGQQVQGRPDVMGQSNPVTASGNAPQQSGKATQTVTVIDGSSGKRQEFQIPGGGTEPASAETKKGAVVDQRLLEQTRHGAVPRIAADGLRPAEAYARPAPQTNPGAPRIALVIGGLGISSGGTNDALTKLPGAVTFAIAPYANDLDTLTTRARGDGHEILLQIPMEPFDYPDNDPGPQTLLASLAAEQNIDRLQWLMARTQGYVGIINFMGARFTAAEQALAPVLREASKRGLIFVDDGSSPRSMASQMAGANTMPFAKADVVLDAAPTPAEIDRALIRLEGVARDRGVAIGFASALPVTIDRIAKWAKTAASRGIVLTPITATVLKPKSS
jgi:polysaccharide deacetylase 2 family uncharacterized protein YibQ